MGVERKTILIADDSLMIRNLLIKNLEKEYTVPAEDTGMKAVKTFGANADVIDLVILDYEMPELDGSKVLQVIRKMNKDVPVMILSGTLDEKRVARLHKLGANKIKSKPVDLNTFPQEIKDLIRIREIRAGGDLDNGIDEEENNNDKKKEQGE